MENSAFIEKRAFHRFPVNIPLNYFLSDSERMVRAQTYDISEQGLGVVTNEELPVGYCVDIRLQMIDNGEQIYRRGRVVWTKTINFNKYRAGIKLEQPGLKPIQIVLRTIKALRDY